MKKLNRELLEGYSGPADLAAPPSPGELHERVIQFGEGNFLRAFADWLFHRLNCSGLFRGRVVVVQPLEEGLVHLLNEQEGLYTLIMRGLERGRAVEQRELISSVSRGLNPYKQWEEYLRCAEDPAIEFVLSNTTEAGIVYDPEDRLDLRPPRSFPGKLAAYLYHRFIHFAGDPEKGMVVLPCELIDRNGDHLKKVLLQLARAWALPAEFSSWLERCNIFLNTLVDRVVTGYPEEEADELNRALGYRDRLLVTSELFHLWVIEGPAALKKRLPFEEAGLNVIWTDDITPYRTRKVRILNGAHTAAVPAAYLYGLETVGEMVAHPLLGRFARSLIFDEIIPSIGLEQEMLQDFAHSVWERFHNPYIKHYLESILLNSLSKFTTRVLPSLEGYYEREGRVPPKLSLSLAALLAFYRSRCGEGAGGPIKEEPQVLSYFSELWQGAGAAAWERLAKDALGSTALWGSDLNELPGLTAAVAAHLETIEAGGIAAAIERVMEGGGYR